MQECAYNHLPNHTVLPCLASLLSRPPPVIQLSRRPKAVADILRPPASLPAYRFLFFATFPHTASHQKVIRYWPQIVQVPASALYRIAPHRPRPRRAPLSVIISRAGAQSKYSGTPPTSHHHRGQVARHSSPCLSSRMSSIQETSKSQRRLPSPLLPQSLAGKSHGRAKRWHQKRSKSSSMSAHRK